ncbi:hypothetical protein EMI94_08550, partial [Listeria monocytogenes]|nr:hypothetical protein [Listeria monocytogenes]
SGAEIIKRLSAVATPYFFNILSSFSILYLTRNFIIPFTIPYKKAPLFKTTKVLFNFSIIIRS